MIDSIIEDETPSNKLWTPGYDADQYDPCVMPFQQLQRPTRRADNPISPLLAIFDVGIIDALELSAFASKKKDVEALLMIIANLLRPEIIRGDGWIFYSRDTNRYSQSYVRFYYPKSYTRTYVLRMIDKLREANLIDHETAHASPQSWFRSRFRPKPDFASNLRRLRRRPRRARSQLIVLKDADKRLILIEDSCIVRALRRDVAEQNEALQEYDIRLATEDLSSELLWQFELDQPCHDFIEDLLYRVFNIDLLHGGRFYGPLWQRLPKWLRHRILISGSATVEPDLATCHPRLLCAIAGVDLPYGDPDFDFYELLGRSVPIRIGRPMVKTAFGIMICASSELSAIRAMVKELRKAGIQEPYQHAERTLAALSEELPKLQQYFFSGIGLRLQNIDAGICANVQQYCRANDIPCLSIHDGFRVKEAHESIVVDLMEEEMKKACAEASA